MNLLSEDPSAFITFEQEAIRAVGDNPRGKYVIEKYGLDRPELEEARQARYEDVERALVLAEVNTKDQDEIDDLCRALKLEEKELVAIVAKAVQVKDTAARAFSPFAGMIRANFPNLPIE